MKMEFNPYVEQTVEALTTMKESQDVYQYHLKRQKDSAELVWKKHVPAEDITVRVYGTFSFKLKSIDIFGRSLLICVLLLLHKKRYVVGTH